MVAVSLAEQDASKRECPYHKICNMYEPETCIPDEYFWGECWVNRVFVGILRDDVEIIEYKNKSIRDIIEENNEN